MFRLVTCRFLSFLPCQMGEKKGGGGPESDGTSPYNRLRLYRSGTHHAKNNAYAPIFGSVFHGDIAPRSAIGRCCATLFVVFCLSKPRHIRGESDKEFSATSPCIRVRRYRIGAHHAKINAQTFAIIVSVSDGGRYGAALGYRAMFPIVICRFLALSTMSRGRYLAAFPFAIFGGPFPLLT